MMRSLIYKSPKGDNMSHLQVLVAAMHQSDFSLYNKMRLQSDAIIANQNGENNVSVQTINGHEVKLISTDTTGVGRNRNIALHAADADILLFADDDTAYYDGYAEAVMQAFRNQPDADLMVFGIDITRNGEVFKTKGVTKGRKRIWKALRYGTGVLAVRRQSILKANVFFSLLFGGGCVFSCGEDSLFLVECLRRGLKLYADPFVLGASAKDTSTWFAGFNKKFFYDKGVWIAAAFPRIKHLIKFYFLLRQKKSTDLSAGEMLRQMNRGIRAYRTLRPYTE